MVSFKATYAKRVWFRTREIFLRIEAASIVNQQNY